MRSREVMVFEPRGSRQMDMLAYPLGLLLAGIKLKGGNCNNMALHVMDEANRCLQCKVPQCQKGCPINTNIPKAIKLLKENKLNDAGKMRIIRSQPYAALCVITKNSVKVTVYLAKKVLLYIFQPLKIIYLLHLQTR